MSHTINLVAGLLNAARDLQDLGRTDAALNLLERLAGFRGLAPAIAEEVHSRLAELYAQREQYKLARRHLTVALTYSPQHGGYHHRMATYIESDPDADQARAARYYRCAVKGDADNADYWADYGAHLLASGRTDTGRRALRRAFALASHDADHVGRIAVALRDADLWDEARQMLRRALFQSSRDRRFRALWQQHQFEQLCQRQHDAAPSEPPAASGPAPRVNRLTILPFLRTGSSPRSMRVRGKIIRFDSAAHLAEPKRDAKSPRKRGTK